MEDKLIRRAVDINALARWLSLEAQNPEPDWLALRFLGQKVVEHGRKLEALAESLRPPDANNDTDADDLEDDSAEAGNAERDDDALAGDSIADRILAWADRQTHGPTMRREWASIVGQEEVRSMGLDDRIRVMVATKKAARGLGWTVPVDLHIRPLEYMTTRETAAIVGVDYEAFSMFRNLYPTFPRPISSPADPAWRRQPNGHIFSRRQVTTWLKNMGENTPWREKT